MKYFLRAEKTFFRDLKNNQGTSLVGALVASALGIVLVTVVMSGVSEMYSAHKDVDMNSRAMAMVDELSIRFNSVEACDASLGGATRSFVPGGSVSISPIQMTVNGQTATLANGTQILNTGWSVRAITLETSTNNAGAATNKAEVVNLLVGGASVPFNKHLGNVRISLVRTDGSGLVPPDILIPISFLGNAADKIYTCGRSELKQSMCQSMNYVWDTATGKCIKANECVSYGSYSDPGAPGAFVNPVSGFAGCPASPAGISIRRVGTITQAYQSSKYGISAALYNVYECVRCVDSSGAVIDASVATIPYVPGSGFKDETSAQINNFDSTNSNLKGSCTYTLPAYPPYIPAPITYNIPCPTTTTTPPASCPRQVVRWTVGASACMGYTAITAQGSTSTVAAISYPLGRTGSAVFDCLPGGTWSPTPRAGAVCGVPVTTTTTTTTTVPPPNCPAGTLSCSVTLRNRSTITCNVNAPSAYYGNSTGPLAVTNPPRSGTCTFTCTKPMWRQPGGWKLTNNSCR